MSNNDKRFAILIDSDNISAKYVKYILDEASNEGTATYKRIYGDWTSPQLASWKDVLLGSSITPIQQYSYTTGKNATDSAMIIDAMDILYSNTVEGFFLVSSDSDFTRLASRLRESGMFVVGMGERKTPTPFIAACNKFKYLDILAKESEKAKREERTTAEQPQEPEKPNQSARASKNEIRRAIRTIITEKSDDSGWVRSSDIGNILSKRYPDFDTRDYGHSKLTSFIASFPMFEVHAHKAGNSTTKQFYARIRE